MSIHFKGKNKRGLNGWTVVIQYQHQGRARRKAFVVRGSKAEARTFEAKMRSELEEGASVDRPNVVPRFSDFCVNVYRPSAEVHLKHSTWLRRTSHLATLIEFFGSYVLTEIDEVLVDRFIEARRRAKLKRVSVNNELRVLRRVLRFAREERGFLLRKLTISFLRTGTRRPKVWTEDEVRRLFIACERTAPDILPLLVFLANTGCRRGEALALTWDHVDLDRGLVLIWPQDRAHGNQGRDAAPDEGWEPKNKKPREVPISTDLLPWLNGERASDVWVFPCTSTGNRWACWPQKKFEQAQKAAGLSGGVHTLRHTFASHFLAKQPDMFLLAQILGHTQTRVTELYAHLTPSHLERGRDAVSMAPAIGPALLKARLKWRTDPRRAERHPRRKGNMSVR